jgi:AcrR family transcriptional regulator
VGPSVKGPGAKKAAAKPAEKPRIRERILCTAADLFYRNGIHAVGVDTIASEAGTNKMSLYRNFASKEELVAEYLREQERAYWEFWEETTAPHDGDPRAQVEALFAVFAAPRRSEPSSGCKLARGCALGNAAVELSDADGALYAIVQAYKGKLRDRLRKLARQMKAQNADALGDGLMLLLEGCFYSRLCFQGGSGPTSAALEAAQALMDAHGVPR